VGLSGRQKARAITRYWYNCASNHSFQNSRRAKIIMMRLEAESSDAGKRLDHFLQERLQEYSRSRLQDWIKQGLVRVDGASRTKASSELRGNEIIEVEPVALPPLKAEAEDLPVEILYEDDDLIAVNKPSGLVVHAGAGHHEGTLVNRLVHRFGTLSNVGGDLAPGHRPQARSRDVGSAVSRED